MRPSQIALLHSLLAAFLVLRILEMMPDEAIPKQLPADLHAAEATQPDPTKNYWPGGPDEVFGTLTDGTKVKRRMLRMRACTEKDAKGKMCRGHLKRWFETPAQLLTQFGNTAEVYRCERCKTVYLPNPFERPRTQTIGW